MNGTLYIVATPIGNPKDITFRAVEILQSVNFILAEDTRKTSLLLKTLKIEGKKLISYYSQKEKDKAGLVIEHLLAGESGALVSDAGTPLISDPGHILIKLAVLNHIPIISIPGACAITTLLPLSGFPLGSFYFGGFLSIKSGKRKNELRKLLDLKTTLIFYESPHRILKTLADMLEVFGAEMEVVIGRELTKTFEEIIRGNLKYVLENSKFVVKGEFCIVLKNI
jgi:16S rRNA (cytidine1402-2'-O)-methyltransferase